MDPSWQLFSALSTVANIFNAATVGGLTARARFEDIVVVFARLLERRILAEKDQRWLEAKVGSSVTISKH